MSDTNFSSKIDPDVKERLADLIENSKLTSKDFMSRLVQSYEASQVKESLGQVKELEQLRHHVSRVEEIYIAIVKAAHDRKEADAGRIVQAEAEVQAAKAEAHQREKEAVQAIESADQRVQAAQTELDQIKEQTSRELAEMREGLAREKEAREQSARLASLAEQAASAAQEKAQGLEEQVKKSEQYRQERDELSQKNKAFENHVNQLQVLLDQTRTEAKKELEFKEERLQETIERLKEQHHDALTRAREKAEVEKEKAVLVAQREFIEEVGRLRESLSQCREEKAQLEAQLIIVKNTGGQNES